MKKSAFCMQSTIARKFLVWCFCHKVKPIPKWCILPCMYTLVIPYPNTKKTFTIFWGKITYVMIVHRKSFQKIMKSNTKFCKFCQWITRTNTWVTKNNFSKILIVQKVANKVEQGDCSHISLWVSWHGIYSYDWILHDLVKAKTILDSLP